MQRWLFQRELEKFSGQPVYYLDAGGGDHRLDREFGRAPRGERISEAVAGKRRERTSLIGAFRPGKLVAPLAFQGRCNTAVVEIYFAQVLLPALPPGSVIVLASARIRSRARRSEGFMASETGGFVPEGKAVFQAGGRRNSESILRTEICRGRWSGARR